MPIFLLNQAHHQPARTETNSQNSMHYICVSLQSRPWQKIQKTQRPPTWRILDPAMSTTSLGVDLRNLPEWETHSVMICQFLHRALLTAPSAKSLQCQLTGRRLSVDKKFFHHRTSCLLKYPCGTTLLSFHYHKDKVNKDLHLENTDEGQNNRTLALGIFSEALALLVPQVKFLSNCQGSE